MRILLTSRQPMFVWWGDELINLYNDAYKTIVGGKHPQALGQPASVVWREIWDQVGPRAKSAMTANEGTYDEALLLIMERHGYREETYYTFSYSPVPSDTGDAGGILCANTDDTQRIIGARQLALLRELAARTTDARTIDDACSLSAQSLETNSSRSSVCIDLSAGFRSSARGACGDARALPPESRSLRRSKAAALDGTSVWPFAEVLHTHAPTLVTNLESTGAAARTARGTVRPTGRRASHRSLRQDRPLRRPGGRPESVPASRRRLPGISRAGGGSNRGRYR